MEEVEESEGGEKLNPLVMGNRPPLMPKLELPTDLTVEIVASSNDRHVISKELLNNECEDCGTLALVDEEEVAPPHLLPESKFQTQMWDEGANTNADSKESTVRIKEEEPEDKVSVMTDLPRPRFACPNCEETCAEFYGLQRHFMRKHAMNWVDYVKADKQGKKKIMQYIESTCDALRRMGEEFREAVAKRQRKVILYRSLPKKRLTAVKIKEEVESCPATEQLQSDHVPDVTIKEEIQSCPAVEHEQSAPVPDVMIKEEVESCPATEQEQSAPVPDGKSSALVKQWDFDESSTPRVRAPRLARLNAEIKIKEELFHESGKEWMVPQNYGEISITKHESSLPTSASLNQKSESSNKHNNNNDEDLNDDGIDVNAKITELLERSNVSKTPPFQCPICKTMISYYNNLRRHMLQTHFNGTKKTSKMGIVRKKSRVQNFGDSINKKSSNQNSKKPPIDQSKVNPSPLLVKVFKCHTCDQAAFTRSCELQTHIKKCHPGQLQKTGPPTQGKEMTKDKMYNQVKNLAKHVISNKSSFVKPRRNSASKGVTQNDRSGSDGWRGCENKLAVKGKDKGHSIFRQDKVGKKPFYCKTCGTKFSREDSLQRHKRLACQNKLVVKGKNKNHHIFRKDKVGKKKQFYCKTCETKFSREDSLQRHKGKGICKLKIKMPGKICKKLSPPENKTATHVKRAVKVLPTAKCESKPFQCRICKTGFNHRRNAIKHIRKIHMKGKSVPSSELNHVVVVNIPIPNRSVKKGPLKETLKAKADESEVPECGQSLQKEDDKVNSDNENTVQQLAKDDIASKGLPGLVDIKEELQSEPELDVFSDDSDDGPLKESQADNVQFQFPLLSSIKEMQRNDDFQVPRKGFIKLLHPETSGMVEIEERLLLHFIRPFLESSNETKELLKTKTEENSEINLVEAHSLLRKTFIKDGNTKEVEVEKEETNDALEKKVSAMKKSIVKSKGRMRNRSQSHSPVKRMRKSSVENMNKNSSKKIAQDNHVVESEKPTNAVFPCSHCSIQFTSWEDLLAHKETIQLDGPFECDKCGTTCSTKRKLKRHMMTSHGQGVICKECGKRFLDNYNLNNHVRAIHTGETPFKCNYCDKMYASAGAKHKHIVRHHQDDKLFEKEHA